MRALALCAAGAVLVGATLSVADARSKGPARYSPDPSSVFAAEIALGRMAREKGQWTAFRNMAADGAVIALARAEPAHIWLKNKKDPAQAARWQAHRAYVSCDGRLGAVTGAWQSPGQSSGQSSDQGSDDTQGYFTTIWQRDKKGEWKWVFDHWDRLTTPREDTDILEGHVASCKGLPGRKGADAGPPSSAVPAGKGRDKGNMPPPPDDSLRWNYDIRADGGRDVRVSLWNGSGYDVVIEDKVMAP